MKIVVNEIGESKGTPIVTEYYRNEGSIEFADFRFEETYENAAPFTVKFVKGQDILHFGLSLEALEIIVDFYHRLFDDEGQFLSKEEILDSEVGPLRGQVLNKRLISAKQALNKC